MIKENIGDWSDVMVDLETTGVDGSQNAILQIAACRFDLLLGQVNREEAFEVCLQIPYGRHWDEGTRHWWASTQEKRDTYTKITAEAIPADEAIQKFAAWLGHGKPRLWAKPSHFEFPFLASYFRQFNGNRNPFHYREVQDVNSWIRARYWPNQPAINEYSMPFNGTVHNALDDVIHQIKLVLAVSRHTRTTMEIHRDKEEVIEESHYV